MTPASISAIFILFNLLIPSSLLSSDLGILVPKLIEESELIVLPIIISGKLISNITIASVISSTKLKLFYNSALRTLT